MRLPCPAETAEGSRPVKLWGGGLGKVFGSVWRLDTGVRCSPAKASTWWEDQRWGAGTPDMVIRGEWGISRVYWCTWLENDALFCHHDEPFPNLFRVQSGPDLEREWKSLPETFVKSFGQFTIDTNIYPLVIRHWNVWTRLHINVSATFSSPRA